MHMLEKIIEAQAEKDNNNNKEKLKEELKTINYISSKVTNILLCRFYKIWIDIKMKSKENLVIEHKELSTKVI